MITKFLFAVFVTLLLLKFTNQSQIQSEERKIKAIVFDFGGVIAKSDRNEIACFIAQSFQITVDEAFGLMMELKKHPNKDNELQFWQEYAASRGMVLSEDWMFQLNEIKFNSHKVIPGMIDLVRELQLQGYRTALLSNVRKTQAEIKAKLGYYELFNPTIFSYETGVKKPDPQAYINLMERLNLLPHEILFIDNNLPNIEGAIALGLDAIHFVDADSLVVDLKIRGIEIRTQDYSNEFLCETSQAE